MSDNVYLNADRTAVVDATDPGKKWQVRRKEAQRLGLIPDGDAKPQARRAAPEDTKRDALTAPEDTERTFTTTTSPTDKVSVRRSVKK